MKIIYFGYNSSIIESGEKRIAFTYKAINIVNGELESLGDQSLPPVL